MIVYLNKLSFYYSARQYFFTWVWLFIFDRIISAGSYWKDRFKQTREELESKFSFKDY
jgi:hypothetical protein